MRLFLHSFIAALALIPARAWADDGTAFYRQGAIVRKIEAADGDDGYRLISLGLYSYNEGGNVVHRLGIYDITDPNDIYGVDYGLCDGPPRRRFPLKSGGREYVLTLTNCGMTTIQFGRPGREDQISTTRDELFTARARFAIRYGQPVYLGNVPLIAIYQIGAKHPGYAFFRTDALDQISSYGAAAGRPVFFVETQERDSNGQWVNKSGPLVIGKIDDTTYALRRNYADQKWDVITLP